jgi:hypothetical protein
MTHNYATLDKVFVKNLEFNIDYGSSISNNYKMDSVPLALSSLLTSKMPEKQMFSTNYYNSNVITNELQSVFPFISEIKYDVSLTSYFLENLKSKNTVNYDKSFLNTFAPIAVRYTNGTNLWLIERPPFQANISYKSSGSNHHGKETSYSIWMPWTVMLLDVHPEQSSYDAHLYFNDGPIASLDDFAVPCFFPNMYGDGRMCLNQSGLMLQQHLSRTNSFDIATIYNFLINDYMSGGWNLDLGIQNFDRIRNLSELTKKSFHEIVHGISGNKKYPNSTSPRTGRILPKKYVSNFLNYFSLSPMNLILDIVSSVKEKRKSTSNTHSEIRTYSEIIESYNKKNTDVDLILSNYNTGSPIVSNYFRLLVSPKFSLREIGLDDPSTDYAQVAKSIIQVLDIYLNDKLIDICTTTDSAKVIQDFANENPILYIEDEKTVFILDQNPSEEFFKELLNIKETVAI